jgi:hypothetical protein
MDAAHQKTAENLATYIVFARIMIAMTPAESTGSTRRDRWRHAGWIYTDAYTRRPGLETRSISRITGSPSKYFSSI